jgi:hypothetical protein
MFLTKISDGSKIEIPFNLIKKALTTDFNSTQVFYTKKSYIDVECMDFVAENVEEIERRKQREFSRDLRILDQED